MLYLQRRNTILLAGTFVTAFLLLIGLLFFFRTNIKTAVGGLFDVFSTNDTLTPEDEDLTFSTQSVSSCTVGEDEWIKGKSQLPHVCYTHVQGDTSTMDVGENYAQYASLDYDNNGQVDYLDQFITLSCIINEGKDCPAGKVCDIDGDGRIDEADYELMGSYLHRGASIEVCGDGIDNDNDPKTSDDCTPCEDKDNDEVCEMNDCDDNDASVGYADDYECVYFETNSSSCKTINVCPGECPGYQKNMEEICGDGLDNDCDTEIDETDCTPPENDKDGDGVKDAVDNCPDQSNADQKDKDNDGKGDACDTHDDSQDDNKNNDNNNDSDNNNNNQRGFCGDGKRDITLGEMCDGATSAATYCNSGEICTSSCLCKTSDAGILGDKKKDDALEKEHASVETTDVACGEKDNNSFYDATGEGDALTKEMPGLCVGGEVANFNYSKSAHTWRWDCESGSDTVACSASAERCGDGDVNGGEECDDTGEASLCAAGQACNNLCVCFVKSVNGVCGNKHQDTLYSMQSDTTILSDKDPGLCADGKITDFEYREEDHRWTWTCAGAGAGKDDFCYASMERCGDALTNGSEQCDDGNAFGGDGCSATCLGESTFHFGPVKADGCGDAEIDQGEQCDDGNLMDGDGCSSICRVENGWKCTPTSPSQCGTLECYEHGERYTQYNIMGQCCGGLETLQFEHSPEKIIAPGINIFLCYDLERGQPLCLPKKSVSGWYVSDTKDGPRNLVAKDQCTEIYRDYYHIVKEDLEKDHAYCQYDDERYDKVEFKDIQGTYEQKAIQALLDFCVVKGAGSDMRYYQAHRTTSRAEFIKMLIKTLFIGYEYNVQKESQTYEGNTYFVDVKNTDRFAQYIVKAYELNLLDDFIEEDDNGGLHILPNKRMTKDEMIDIIKQLDIGQDLGDDMLDKFLGVAKYPDRAAVSALLTRKFIDKFMDYFYFSGRNREYLEQLADHLKGKHYADQYTLIIEQIDKLQDGEHIFDDIITPRDDTDFSVFWAVKYLKHLLDTIHDDAEVSFVASETPSEHSSAEVSGENFTYVSGNDEESLASGSADESTLDEEESIHYGANDEGGDVIYTEMTGTNVVVSGTTVESINNEPTI